MSQAENTEESVQSQDTNSALTGGAVSFDELDGMSGAPSAQAAEPSEQAPQETEVQAEVSETADPKPPASAAEKAAQELEKGAQQKDIDKAQNNSKLYTVKQGEKDVQLRGDAMLEVPIAGKPEKVSFQDLLTNYAGKTDWTRKYTELDKERQTFKQDRAEVDGVINSFLGTAPENPMLAITQLGEASGYDMAKFWREFRTQLDPIMEERMKLSTEERKARDLENEVEFYKKRDESQQSIAARDKSVQAEKQKVEKLLETHGIDQETFHSRYEDLKSSGQIPEGKLTADLVVEYHQELDARQTLRGLLQEVNPKLKNPNKAISELREVMLNHPDFSIEDLKHIAIEVHGDKKAQNLSRKVQKSESTNTASPSKARVENPISFEELM